MWLLDLSASWRKAHLDLTIDLAQRKAHFHVLGPGQKLTCLGLVMLLQGI